MLGKYLKECNEVYHTTFDPKGPGSVRIHLIPPKKKKIGVPWVVMLNGYSILPLQTSWAILLKEFILRLNKTEGKILSGEDIDNVVEDVTNSVAKIYSSAKKNDIRKDLYDIVKTLKDVAFGKTPNEKIGFMTLKQYAKNMVAPHRMDLMISSMEKNGRWNCNNKCMHCYAAKDEMSISKEIDTKSWERIIDKCREAMIPQLTFTGGEPTLRSDLPKLVSYASWFVTRVNTNGVLLTEELSKDLYDASLDSIQITLYSCDEHIHNLLVGTNHFKDTVNGIKNALNAGLNVSINTPLCSLNKNYLDTVKFLHNLGIKYFSCSGLITTGNALNNDSIKTRLSNYEITEIVKEAFNYTKENGLELAFTSPGFISENDLKSMNMVVPSCGASLSNMAIAPDGEVIPCQSWLKEDALGNLLEKSFSSIWNDKRCKEIRNESSKTEHKCPLSEKSGVCL